MRRLAALLMLGLLAACNTTDGLSPDGSSTMAGATPAIGTIAVRYPRFGDSDPHDWTGRAPWQNIVHGADVSKYQTDVDWRQARANGISFVFIKATEGGDRVDDKFAQHWRETRAAGLPRAAYHFYYFCRTAAEQARWFIQNVPNDRSAMPPVVDMEWNPQSPTCKLRPDAATVRSEMQTFLQMVEKYYGKKPIIYTSIDFFDDNGLSGFRGYPYWLRSVAGHPSERYGDHPFVFWQYTGTGVVPGIKGDADISVFNGSDADWRKWVKANTQ
jgi:lysozyme